MSVSVLSFLFVVLALLSAAAGGDAVAANQSTSFPVFCHLTAGDGAELSSLADCALTQLSITETAAFRFKGNGKGGGLPFLKCLSAIHSAAAHLRASKNDSHVHGKKLDAVREFCLAEKEFAGGCPIPPFISGEFKTMAALFLGVGCQVVLNDAPPIPHYIPASFIIAPLFYFLFVI